MSDESLIKEADEYLAKLLSERKNKEEKQRLYNEWFMAEVDKGVKSAREKPLVEHEDAIKQIHTIKPSRMVTVFE